MAPITEHLVRELAGFKGRGAPVTTCYLDVDGRRYPRSQEYEHQLGLLLRRAREGTGEQPGPEPDDLRRIEEHVKAGIDRSRVRGVAMFSCAADGFWQVVELPVPVRNQLVVNSTPHVRQLEAVLDEYEPMAVLLADRQRARLFLIEMGELVDRTELVDVLPRHEDDRGDFDRDHVRDHQGAAAQRHLKRAAHAAFELFQERGFHHLVVGAPEETASELEKELHSYLRERLAGRISVAVQAAEEEVRLAALEVQERVERAKESALVERLRSAVGAGSGGVAGLEGVLGALVERRVDTLLVSEGFVTPGWRCAGCGFIAALGRSCPVCGGSMTKVDDVVEEAIEEALRQSCTVDICRGNADLDVLGQIGALLRF